MPSTMKLLCCSWAVLLASGNGATAVVAATPSRSDAPAENAALCYWTAFALMPSYSVREFHKIDNATTDHQQEGYAIPLGPEMGSLLERAATRRALVEFRRASEISFCTWGTDPQASAFAEAPYAEPAHRFARLSLLRARWRFEHGLWNDAVDDVIATLMMARHIGRDKISLTIHKGVQIESVAVVTAALYLPRMPLESRRRLAAKLAALPPMTSMQEVYRASERSVDRFIDTVRLADKEGRLRETLIWWYSREAADTVLKQAPDGAALAKFAEDARGLLHEGGDLLALPIAEFRREFERRQFGLRFQQNPVARLLAAMPDGEADEQAVGNVRLALLKAGIDVLERGSCALTAHADPADGGQFQYATFDSGFELRSHLVRPGSKLCESLDFGFRKTGPLFTRPCQ